MKRPTWDEYFLQIAKTVSSRSTCFRSHVGAVIVKNKEIVSTGYNGAPTHQKNCLEIGFCHRNKNAIPSGTKLETCRAVGSHAESNAVTLAAKNGHGTDGGTIYVTGHYFVCNQCKAIIANAGIERVVLETPEGDVSEFIPNKDWNIHPVDQDNY